MHSTNKLEIHLKIFEKKHFIGRYLVFILIVIDGFLLVYFPFWLWLLLMYFFFSSRTKKKHFGEHENKRS